MNDLKVLVSSIEPAVLYAFIFVSVLISCLLVVRANPAKLTHLLAVPIPMALVGLLGGCLHLIEVDKQNLYRNNNFAASEIRVEPAIYSQISPLLADNQN
jgi:hypothetical protein